MYEFCYFNFSIADQNDEDDIFNRLLLECSDTYKPIVQKGIEQYQDCKLVCNLVRSTEWEIDLSKYKVPDEAEPVIIPGIDNVPNEDNWFSLPSKEILVICCKFDMHN